MVTTRMIGVCLASYLSKEKERRGSGRKAKRRKGSGEKRKEEKRREKRKGEDKRREEKKMILEFALNKNKLHFLLPFRLEKLFKFVLRYSKSSKKKCNSKAFPNYLCY